MYEATTRTSHLLYFPENDGAARAPTNCHDQDDSFYHGDAKGLEVVEVGMGSIEPKRRRSSRLAAPSTNWQKVSSIRDVELNVE